LDVVVGCDVDDAARVVGDDEDLEITCHQQERKNVQECQVTASSPSVRPEAVQVSSTPLSLAPSSRHHSQLAL
jgi:hypothetical protein